MINERCEAMMRSKWFMPAFCLVLGVVLLIASALGGHVGDGLVSLAILGGFGVVLLLVRSRSETIRGLTTDRDERFVQIDLKATAATGLVLILTVIGAWLAQTAEGHNGHPYDWLAAIGGLAYLLAVVLFRWRG